MGTVGLSFGSPTSGDGFDVSSTVASIISNLKNVETPWNTQLTKLESQDTTISSLGTLFSKLSNDMSSLTDLQGIMAQKEGSSSDQNVLTLTAANSTAVAGTHTVTVTSLAETSSGYLAPISPTPPTRCPVPSRSRWAVARRRQSAFPPLPERTRLPDWQRPSMPPGWASMRAC